MSSVNSGGVRVRHVLSGEHDLLRQLRLASLAADPEAFASTYAEDAGQPAEWWRWWAAQSEDGTTQRTFVLVADDGRWLGLTLVRLDGDKPGSAVLNAMWIAPEARRRRAAGLLCEACAKWAAERGCSELTLTVVLDNQSARRAYEGAGFAVCGKTTWSRDGRTLDEVVMARSLLFESSEGGVIDESLAGRLIDSQFPQWAHLPITAVELDGWDNRSFRLGSELTVRLPGGNWYAQQVDKEQHWLPVLAPQLPLPIPSPVAKGEPDAEFPYPWSVYRWLDGEPASTARIGDLGDFATTLARFLNALGRVDATDGPTPGQHNFFRGGPLGTYEVETIEAIAALADEIPVEDVKRVWADAKATSWERDAVWIHGDVAASNLLVRDGRLAAVLDFGCSGVGDPACDTVIAWTFLSGSSRDRFRAERDLDSGTWSRGRGWALWKALITLAGHLESGAPEAAVPRREIARIVADYAQDR